MNPKSKAQRLTVYILTNTVMAFLLYRGVTGTAGAQNVFVFLAWLGCFSSLLFSVGGSIQERWLSQGGRSVPQSVSVAVDLGFVTTLVCFDWWWTALATLISLLASQSGMAEAEKKVLKES